MVQIISFPKETKASISVEVKYLYHWDSLNNQIACIGKAQLYLQKDIRSKNLEYGDQFFLYSTTKQVEESENLHQFSFKEYYNHKGIYHSDFVRSEFWSSSKHNNGNLILSSSNRIRSKLLKRFNQYFKDDSIRGIAEAIIFGYKGELDDDILNAFSETGTIHVLAVSGLHVGTIYVLLAFMLSLSKNNRKFMWAKTIVVIICLFTYALITGLTPSVSRASLMFGLVLVGNIINRQTNTLNTLCFAALVLLIVDPYSLYNLGFQFSFLAVIGIVCFTPFFQSIIASQNYMLKKIGTLCSVSISAQIATFPLGLYYFNQFPLLFIFSNLLIIPCVAIIVYSGVVFIVSSFIVPVFAAFCASVISAYIKFMISVVYYIQQIPNSFLSLIHITEFQVLLIYLFIVVLTITLKFKSKSGLIFSVILCVLFLVADLQFIQDEPRLGAIRFTSKNRSFIAFRDRESVVFLLPKDLQHNDDTYKYVIKPYVINERLQNSFEIMPEEVIRFKGKIGNVQLLGNGYIWFNNKSYFYPKYLESSIAEPISSDFLIVSSEREKRYNDKMKSKEICLFKKWD